MPSGPHHYREAVNQLDAACYFVDEGLTDRGEQRLKIAQVHATLALVAATALNPALPVSSVDAAAWRGALARSQPAEEGDDG